MKKNTGRKKNSYYKRKKTTKPNVVSKKSNELKKTIPEKKVDIKKEKEKQTVKKETEEIKFYSFEEVKQEDNLDQAVFLNDANDSQENETNPSKDLEDTSTLEDELNSSINNYSDEKNNDDFTFLNEVKKQQQDNINTQSENTVSYNKSKYKFYLSYEQRLILNLVAIIMLFVLALTIFLSSITIRSRSSMAYNQSSNLNYNVSLKENDYYNDENLNQNMQYIASLIDYIDVDFNYNFNASNTFDYTYTYYIESYVSVTDGEDDSKVIYSKIDKLTDPVTVANDNSSGFNINQNVRINYDEYNDLVKEFKSTYGLSADSNLVLSLRLEIKDKTGTVIRSLDASDTTKITIPLTQQLVNIEIDPEDVNNSNNIRVYQDFNISNKFAFILSIIILLSAVASIIRLIIFMKKTTRKKSAYDNMLSKILKEYDRVIVNAKKAPVISGEVIDVNSFNELLDVRDNIEKPIIFYELHKGQKSIFIVNSDANVYRYILKLPDLEK